MVHGISKKNGIDAKISFDLSQKFIKLKFERWSGIEFR